MQNSNFMSQQDWTEFARTGDPNGKTGPTWQAFDPTNPHEMELGATINMRPVERKENYRILLTNQYSLLEELESEPEDLCKKYNLDCQNWRDAASQHTTQPGE